MTKIGKDAQTIVSRICRRRAKRKAPPLAPPVNGGRIDSLRVLSIAWIFFRYPVDGGRTNSLPVDGEGRGGGLHVFAFGCSEHTCARVRLGYVTLRTVGRAGVDGLGDGSGFGADGEGFGRDSAGPEGVEVVLEDFGGVE